MSVRVWNTAEPVGPEFASAWTACLAGSDRAHFEFNLEYRAWAAGQGEPARVVLVDDSAGRAALVLRPRGAEFVCGRPWRWDALIERDGAPPCGFTAEEADWLFEHASRVAGSRRLRCYLPWVPGRPAPHFRAGATYLQPLAPTEEEMLQRLDSQKRRTIRKCLSLGYEVLETRESEHLRAFAALQRQNQRHRGETQDAGREAAAAEAPSPGEGWREWEQPWMWLLVAVKDGSVQAGSGFGVQPGGCLDYRANASSEVGRKDGANVLLAWEAMQRGRARGLHWLNWGGATHFKRDFGGERVNVYCRLGGGIAWAAVNRLEAASRHGRQRAAGLWKSNRARLTPATPPAPAPASAPRRRPARAEPAISRWSTRAPLDPAFEREWGQVLARASRAGFSLDLAYLAWEARHGRHALAALVGDRDQRGIMVLREGRAGYVCGWPWRVQVALDEREPPASPWLTPAEAEWAFQGARCLAGGSRLRFYLPMPPPRGTPAFEAGATIIQTLACDDDEFLRSMASSKRRMVRRALNEGYTVIEGGTHEQMRAFAHVQRATSIRHGRWGGPEPGVSPPPGENWREWEHPWMWLLLALRDGAVESGLGDGIRAGAMLDGRAGASSARARRDGAFALLCFEEMRRGRERGFRWLNHCGCTQFKRDVAGRLGQHATMYCWLGGGVGWTLANRSEALARRTRPRAAAWVRGLFRGRKAAP